MMRRPMTAAVVTALVITAGCGGSDSSSDTTDQTTATSTTSPAPTTSTIPVPVDETIAGTVIFAGDVGTGAIIVVANLVGSNDPPTLVAVLEAAGPYVLTDVADGEYIVQAFLDSANDRGPPETGEPQGFYDANEDGTADSVFVAGGVGLIEIDITLV